MNTLIIFGAKYLIVVPILVLVYYYWKNIEARKRILKLTLYILPASFVLAKIGSYFLYIPRPFVSDGITPLIQHVADNGFPSDHTLLASAIASLFLFINRKWAIWLWVITIIIATSRVLVGVHHTIDVVGSILISLLVAGMIYSLHKKLNQHGE